VDIAPEQGLQQLRHAPASRMAAGPGRRQQQRGWAGSPALSAIAPPASLGQGLISSTTEAEITIVTPVHPRLPHFPVKSFAVRFDGLPTEQGVVVGAAICPMHTEGFGYG
jgi:hypothetical protein